MVAKTTKAEVLLRSQKLLAKRLEGKFNGPIYIVVDEQIPSNLGNNGLITIQITGGQFDFAAQVGGAQNSLQYSATLRVAFWSSSRTDRAGLGAEMLTASGRGLLRLETQILSALLGSYLQEVDAGGNGTPVLTMAMHALSDSQAQTTGESSHSAATMAVDFGVNFWWDLSGDTDGEPE